ncbi:hypothetical protein KC320_g67 [Hortaea werneckii]|nr:hypothetical protein KC320_g67 [Hortaea werneckii]
MPNQPTGDPKQHDPSTFSESLSGSCLCGSITDTFVIVRIHRWQVSTFPVKSETAAYPGKVVVKMGMMPRIPQPEMEGFGLHRHEWQGTHEGVQIYKIKWAGPEKELMS